jgi:DNA-binding transcriptional regulator YiaG
MPDIQSSLKSEIARLSKKTIKQYVAPLRAASTTQRREIAALRAQLQYLERALRAAGRETKKAEPSAEGPTETKLRFRAEGFKKHRERLGLSAEEAGTLIGVSGQTIYNWEHGKATPRGRQLPAIAALRNMGKRDAANKLSSTAR